MDNINNTIINNLNHNYIIYKVKISGHVNIFVEVPREVPHIYFENNKLRI